MQCAVPVRSWLLLHHANFSFTFTFFQGGSCFLFQLHQLCYQKLRQNNTELLIFTRAGRCDALPCLQLTALKLNICLPFFAEFILKKKQKIALQFLGIARGSNLIKHEVKRYWDAKSKPAVQSLCSPMLTDHRALFILLWRAFDHHMFLSVTK